MEVYSTTIYIPSRLTPIYLRHTLPISSSRPFSTMAVVIGIALQASLTSGRPLMSIRVIRHAAMGLPVGTELVAGMQVDLVP